MPKIAFPKHHRSVGPYGRLHELAAAKNHFRHDLAFLRQIRPQRFPAQMAIA
jgi:hypothetical protein